MPRHWYQIKVYKQRTDVATASTLREHLDWSDVEGADEHLRRTLLAAIDRDQARRNEHHLYHLELRELDHDGRPAGRPFHYALGKDDR